MYLCIYTYNSPDPPWTTFPHDDLSQHYGRSHTVISTGCVLTMQNKVGFEVMASTWNCLILSISLPRALFHTHTHKVHVIDSLSLSIVSIVSISYKYAQGPRHWLSLSTLPSWSCIVSLFTFFLHCLFSIGLRMSVVIY